MLVTYNGAKIYYVDSRDYKNPKVVLSSSSKVAALSTLAYDIDTTKYKEVARINAAVFDLANSVHQGWEYSDVFKTSCNKDERADVIRMKDGTYLWGDIGKDEVDLNQIDWAYSGSHVILKDGQDVCIVASWRTQYTTGSYCWSFFATRDDGSFVMGALSENSTINTINLREFLKSLNCINAIVNDGGGSAEIIINGKIMNRTTERKIANGLFMFEDITPEPEIPEEPTPEEPEEDITKEEALKIIRQINSLTGEFLNKNII